MSVIIRIACVVFFCMTLSGCHSSERAAENAYREGLRSKERGDVKQALQQFRSAVALNSQHVKAQMEIGELLCQDGKYVEAIKHLLRAVEYGATLSEPYAYLGYAYEQLGDLKFAEQSYQQAIARSSGLLGVRLHLADILEAQERWREAADVLRDVLTLKPDIANETIIKARMALLRQPQRPEVYRALAEVYISHDDIQKGLAAYRKFAPLDPNIPETLAAFGIFCAERKQFQTAAVYLKKAIALGVTDQPEIRAALGMVYEELGQFLEAIKEYRIALKLQPNSHELRVKLADLLERSNQLAEAADLLEEDFYKGQATDVNARWRKILQLRGEDSKKAVVQLKPSEKFNLVDVVVNETVPATMIIDTRAEYTIISEELAQRLNILLSTRTSEVRFEFAGTPYTAPLVNLPSLKIGKLEVRNVPTLLWDFSDYPGIDGVVGMTFLKHFQVEIKSDEQLVVLTKLYS